MRTAIVFLVSCLVLSGCSSLTKECLALGPPGNWKVTAEPQAAIAEMFVKSQEKLKRVWFQDDSGRYAMCHDCDGTARRASLFQFLDPKKDKESGGMAVATCGPY